VRAASVDDLPGTAARPPEGLLPEWARSRSSLRTPRCTRHGRLLATVRCRPRRAARRMIA